MIIHITTKQLTLLVPVPLLLELGVVFAELLLFVAASPAAFEPCPLDDITGIELLLVGDRAVADEDFCFGGVFIGGVSSQFPSQLSSRDTLVSCGVLDALSS